MLATLRIRNLALVADLTLEFPPGLVAVTGETGAGKSVILGALNLVLGERADRTLIRAGTDTCTVEAAFDVAGLGAGFRTCLADHGIEPCEQDQLLLKRSFTTTGANRQFVNGTPATLGILGDVGNWLVDMHGPHDHQSLLQPARQLAILDAFGGLRPQVEAFGECVRQRRGLLGERSGLLVDEASYAAQLDLLRFQVQEITGANLRPGEDVELEQEHQRAANAARLLQLGQAAAGLLDGEEPSVSSQVGAVGRLLQELERLDAGAAALGQVQAQAASLLQELETELVRYLERVEVDPERLQRLEERLDLLQTLKRKYGSSVDRVIEFGADARRRLDQLESREGARQRLALELERLGQQLLAQGQALTVARRPLVPRLVKAVNRELRDLGFRQGRFEVALEAAVPGLEVLLREGMVSSSGFDTVEFLFAPNPGEPARALRAIASSGELARVMLALKAVLAAEDEIPVLVFDEVDANVGGETAHAVGDKMRRIAQRRQVFCVTHLPQVAAAADVQFVVTKETRDGRTTARMARLDAEDRVTELARMLGGQSAAARQHARALLSGGVSPGI